MQIRTYILPLILTAVACGPRSEDGGIGGATSSLATMSMDLGQVAPSYKGQLNMASITVSSPAGCEGTEGTRIMAMAGVGSAKIDQKLKPMARQDCAYKIIWALGQGTGSSMKGIYYHNQKEPVTISQSEVASAASSGTPIRKTVNLYLTTDGQSAGLPQNPLEGATPPNQPGPQQPGDLGTPPRGGNPGGGAQMSSKLSQITLRTSSGQTTMDQATRGGYTLVDFSASWCPNCKSPNAAGAMDALTSQSCGVMTIVARDSRGSSLENWNRELSRYSNLVSHSFEGDIPAIARALLGQSNVPAYPHFALINNATGSVETQGGLSTVKQAFDSRCP